MFMENSLIYFSGSVVVLFFVITLECRAGAMVPGSRASISVRLGSYGRR